MDKLERPTKEDLKIAFKRELRQKQETERKERIFNPRTRIIGIDKCALDKIVQEKEQRLLDERNENLCYANELQHQCNIINNQLNELKVERTQLENEMNEFRMKFQRKDQTREFDLNDPNYMKKASAVQKFNWLGEDPTYSHRCYLQKKQQKSWLKQQITERCRNDDNTAKANDEMEKAMMAHDQRLREIDETEKRLRLEVQRKTAFYNIELAQQKKMIDTELKRQMENDNLTEIINHLRSDMLNETKEIAWTSNLLGNKRICVDMYRGMTDEQIQEIRVEQQRQIEEKQQKLNEEREMNARYDDYEAMQCKLLSLDEEKNRQRRHQIMCDQMAVNAQLAQEQKQRNQHLNKTVYKFTPSDEYFDRFNTTTR